jgi:hypothetical protein
VIVDRRYLLGERKNHSSIEMSTLLNGKGRHPPAQKHRRWMLAEIKTKHRVIRYVVARLKTRQLSLVHSMYVLVSTMSGQIGCQPTRGTTC